MSELVFLKLGGSLLTDKTRPKALRADVLDRLAAEIAGAVAARPDLRLLLGHGSGSFGHVTASRYNTRSGVKTPAQWRGFAEVAAVAAELNRHVGDALRSHGAPAISLQPSASALCHAGELRFLAERPISAALENGLMPVVYGDVAVDEVLGGTIVSTEEIFAYLAPRLQPARIILVGEVEGVFNRDPVAGAGAEVVPVITPASLREVSGGLGGSRGVDVTGGMATKVRSMLEVARSVPALCCVHIVSGLVPGLAQEVLIRSDAETGTRIMAS